MNPLQAQFQNELDMVAVYGLLSTSEGVRATVLPHRACESCKRKKTKCDMSRPICSLCRRTGNACIFPTKRKSGGVGVHGSRGGKRRRLDSELDDARSSFPHGRTSPTASAAETPSTLSIPQPNLSNGQTATLDAQSQGTPNLAGTAGLACNANQVFEGLQGSALDDFDAMLGDFITDDLMGNLTAWQSTDTGLFQDGSSNADLLQASCPSPGGVDCLPPATSASTEQCTDKNDDIDGRMTMVTLSVESSIAKSLVDAYFENIHASYPIINRAKWERSCGPLLDDIHRKPELPVDQALLLYGMMALSARFSALPELSHLPPMQRGREYARQAGHIIASNLMDSELDMPSLAFLHGCSLAAVYWLTCRPNGKAWFLVGVCVRIAYSLSLHTTDVDLRMPGTCSVSDEEWARREELRRAWWLVVECDNFASVLHCRPLTIDRARMHVLLPSQDSFWFSGKQCTSAFLDDDTLKSWRNLKASSNRNPHACYLVINQLMIRGHELSRKLKASSPQECIDLRDTIQCVAMSLPREFNLSSASLFSEEGSAGHDNWIIIIHLMMQSALVYAMNVESSSWEIGRSLGDTLDEADPNNNQSPSCVSKTADQYRSTLNTTIRIIRKWSPESCALAQAFQVCTLLGPYAAHLQATYAAFSPGRGDLERDLIHATISRVAEYWEIGRATLDLMNTLALHFGSSTAHFESDQQVQLQCLLPSPTSPSLQRES